MIAVRFFRLAALGRLAAFLSIDASELMRWDGGVVAGLLAAHAAFEDERDERARMAAARSQAAGIHPSHM